MSRVIGPAVAWTALLALAACGPAVAPAALEQLEAERAAVDAARLAEASPEAWREAELWLARARDALAGGDAEEAERCAGLGAIALRTAALGLERREIENRVAGAEAELAELQRERERLASELELSLRAEERARLRAHLEAVVDEERRRAAADEELRDAALPPGDREALEGARLAVAAEIRARARVALSALLGLAEAGALIPEQGIPVLADLDAADAAVAAGDLAGAQERCEDAAVLVRRTVDEAFEAGGGSLSGATAGLLEAARGAGLAERATAEELGVGLSLPVRFSGKGAIERRKGAASIEETAAALGRVPGIAAVLVVAASGTEPGAPGAVARADRDAAAVAGALGPLLAGEGIPVLPVDGIGSAAPLVALRGKGADRVGLLLIPRPPEAAAAP